MSKEVPDPFTELEGTAASMHEIYESHVAAGFSKKQAMQIVTTVIAAAVTQSRGPE